MKSESKTPSTILQLLEPILLKILVKFGKYL